MSPHPSWAADQAAFLDALAAHGLDSVQVGCLCDALDWSHPETWDTARRARFLDALAKTTPSPLSRLKAEALYTAVQHLLTRTQTDPALAALCGPLSDDWALLTRAEAAHLGEPLAVVQARRRVSLSFVRTEVLPAHPHTPDDEPCVCCGQPGAHLQASGAYALCKRCEDIARREGGEA